VIALPTSLEAHRVAVADLDAVCAGHVRYTPIKSVWFLGMLAGVLIGGSLTFSFSAFFLFFVSTAVLLLLGHSLWQPSKARS
jgi:stearoyl-CoA desaturase (delta-9 desaturase)